MLADFGIARLSGEASDLTGTGMTVGTLNCASPEQLHGERVDTRSDQFSLAATAYLFSVDVSRMAAEIVADLPGAGQAWTELAMASSDEPRSELLPILDRAAEEIGYARTPEQAESDILEAAAYRVVTGG